MANLLLGLGRVALLPFGQDPVAVLGGPREIVLDHQLLVIVRNIRLRLGDARHCDDLPPARVELVRFPARDPVEQFFRRFELLGSLDNAGGLDVPAEPFAREHQHHRRADFLTCCARYSNEMPTTNSPAPDWRQGLDPECVYCAMFSCSASMYFQP